jgi:ABC-type Fe3+-hydroxamate transport system substrate-binding protein
MWPRCVVALALVVLGMAAAGAVEGRAGDRSPGQAALRVVSLNPSLTATLLALGARDALVGIDEYSARQQPDLRELPRVGGLFNTSLESLVALEPDLVVLVPSAQQRDLRERLGDVGIEVLSLPNITLPELLASIELLGERVGREEAARQRVAKIRREWRRVEETTRDGPRQRAVLVIQRDPLYVVGAGSYLAAMLQAAGAENAAADFSEPYPRVSLEWLIAAAPQVILDSSDDPLPAAEFWGRWPSLPAVASGRVVAVPAALVTLPGPHPERALRSLAEALRARGSP